jgi:hypothetical protein
MKRERQIGVRVGLPVFFALELEDVYKHASGAHRALAFPGFLGFLIGLGLEQYRQSIGPAKEPPSDLEPQEEPEAPEGGAFNLFNVTPKGLNDMFRDFEKTVGPPPLRLVRSQKTIEEV